MAGLSLALASGCSAPESRAGGGGAERLSPAELLALLADLPESWPESPPETMRIGDLLTRETVAQGGDAFLDGLCALLGAEREYISFQNFMFPLRVDSIAREVRGEAGEKARFLMLYVGQGAALYTGEGYTPSMLAIATKYLDRPLGEVVGEARAIEIRALEDSDLEGELRRASADPSVPREGPEIPPLEAFARLTETPRPALPPGARLSPYDWLWLYWNLWEDSPFASEVACSLRRVLSDSPDDEVASAVIRLLSAPEAYPDLTKSAFWERVEAVLRERPSEASERARYVLLVAGDVYGGQTPLRHGAEREALLQKHRETSLVDLVGEEGLRAIQERSASSWLSPYGEEAMAAEALARVMDPAFRDRLRREGEETWSTRDRVVIDLAIALAEGPGASRQLERRALEGRLEPSSIAVYAMMHLPPRTCLQALSRLLEREALREDVLWTLGRMDLSGAPAEETRFVRDTAEECLASYRAFLDSPAESHEEGSEDAAERLGTAGDLLGALGPGACEEVLRLVRGFRLDRLVVDDIGSIDTPVVYAEERVIEALGKVCGERAAPELLRLLAQEETAVRRAALRALGAVAPGTHEAAVLSLLDDPSPAVQLEAAVCLSATEPSALPEGARDRAVGILRGAFSLEHPIELTVHYVAWDPYEFEQYGRAARAYHRVAPEEALDAFWTILRGLRPWFEEAHEEPGVSPSEGAASRERFAVGWEANRLWSLLLPLYIELGGIDWDEPFPLEHLGVSDQDCAPVVLPELERRRG